jgi:hypothetical protein
VSYLLNFNLFIFRIYTLIQVQNHIYIKPKSGKIAFSSVKLENLVPKVSESEPL